MARWAKSAEGRRERLVHSTLKAGWAKFGAPELDEAMYDYISGVACTVMADVRDSESGERELRENLGSLLMEQDLKEKQVATLCKAIARTVFPPKGKEGKETQESAEPTTESKGKKGRPEKAEGDNVLCCVKDVILMYMGSTKLLLKDTTFELLQSHRYGVVGQNGAGKTTFMERISAGAISDLRKLDLKFVYIRHETLNQRADMKVSAVDFTRSIVGPRGIVHEALDEVGFTDEMRRKPLRELSGGWRVRLLLATAVAQRADVLLLDEPTNHLDAAAVSWLVDYLTKDLRHATALVVSHDAPFLNKICTDIIHFDEAKLKYYAGNFAAFQEQVMLHDEQEVKAILQVRSSDNENPEDDIAEFTKPVAHSVAPSKADSAEFKMSFPIPGKVEGVSSSKKTVIEIKNTWFTYPLATDYALKGVEGKVTMSSRIAIVGPNGAGKSTLMSLICGEIRPTSDEKGGVGEVNRHRAMRLAFIAQDHMDHLADYVRCTGVEYIQLRFRHGWDEELQKRLNSPVDETEDATIGKLASKYGKYGKRVEALVSRTKRKSEWRYEVKWKDLNEKQNTFETVGKLRQLGVERMATALDERLASVSAGTDQRPLTQREIVKHFENFGLGSDLIEHRSVDTLSGGQKAKLMVGSAFWMRPHVVCLDEPSNFLDFETVAALSRALRQFRGGVVIVSHNEDFLASVCNEVWSVEDHEVTVVRADAPPEAADEDEEEGDADGTG